MHHTSSDVSLFILSFDLHHDSLYGIESQHHSYITNGDAEATAVPEFTQGHRASQEIQLLQVLAIPHTQR